MALEHDIAQLGQRMGLAHLALSPDGLMVLEIAGMGTVFFERMEGDLLVYLARPATSHDRSLPRRILTLCHYSQAHPIPLCGGMHKGRAILLTRMPEQMATTAFLEHTVMYLAGRMDTIFRG